MREPHRGVQEWFSRRPSELPPFPGQRLPTAVACRRLQPGQLLPAAVAAALAFGTDRNSACPTVQNRRPHPPHRSLHSRSPCQRLALSKPVPQCRAGFEPRLTRLPVLESIFVRSHGGAVLEQPSPRHAPRDSFAPDALPASQSLSTSKNSAQKQKTSTLMN